MIALSLMPQTDAVKSVLDSELELYKSSAGIKAKDKIVSEVELLS